MDELRTPLTKIEPSKRENWRVALKMLVVNAATLSASLSGSGITPYWVWLMNSCTSARYTLLDQMPA